MSRLEDAYNKRREEFEEYKQKVAAYDARMGVYNADLHKLEVDMNAKIEALPNDVKTEVRNIMNSVSGGLENATLEDKIQVYRKIYAYLETKGLEMLNS